MFFLPTQAKGALREMLIGAVQPCGHKTLTGSCVRRVKMEMTSFISSPASGTMPIQGQLIATETRVRGLLRAPAPGPQSPLYRDQSQRPAEGPCSRAPDPSLQRPESEGPRPLSTETRVRGLLRAPAPGPQTPLYRDQSQRPAEGPCSRAPDPSLQRPESEAC
ncbi:unnamed protein product [Boreogadus saida]